MYTGIRVMMLFGAALVCAPEAQSQGADASDRQRIGQFISLPAQIMDDQVSLVRNRMLDLVRRSDREGKDAALVLVFSPGSSTVGNVNDLARVLIQDDTSTVKTIAWVRDRLVGSHVIAVLACHEIMMSPEAAIGDIGRGQKVPSDEAEFVRRLVGRRRNPRIAPAVAEAMMDPSVGVVRVNVAGEDAEDEWRLVTPVDVQELIRGGAEVRATERIHDPGQLAVFNANEATRLRFLVTDIARSEDDIRYAWHLPPESRRDPRDGDVPLKVQVIAIHGTITPVLSEFVLREIRRTTAEGANLLIFDVDSPGGILYSSEAIANTIADLDPKKVTTVAWIEHDAISGAAIAALGCDQIVMTPDARIGDAGVITVAEDGAFDRVPEKRDSPLLTTLEILAEKKDRPKAILHAMVDRNLHVFEVTQRQTGRKTFLSQLEIDAADGEWIKGAMVPESRDGLLLTVSGKRAHDLHIAEAPCDSIEELRQRLGIPESTSLKPRSATWVDVLVFALNTGVGGFALISVALLCLYLEAHLPGGFFGICATVFFAMFFWSRYLGGTAGSLELILFLVGTGLLLLEIFVVPGFGVFGISGILLIFGSLIMASHTFAGMSAGERFEESMSSLGSVAGALVTVIVVASVLNHFLPFMPIVGRLILTPPGQIANDSGPKLTPEAFDGSGPVAVGDQGTATSILRPAGKATFGEQYVDVVSDGSWIDHGSPIEVVRVAGNRVIVREVRES